MTNTFKVPKPMTKTLRKHFEPIYDLMYNYNYYIDDENSEQIIFAKIDKSSPMFIMYMTIYVKLSNHTEDFAYEVICEPFYLDKLTQEPYEIQELSDAVRYKFINEELATILFFMYHYLKIIRTNRSIEYKLKQDKLKG